MLEEEHLPLLLNVRLANLLVTDLAKLLGILQKVVNLEVVLLGKKGHEMLHALDLPVVILELKELLEEEAVLVGNHLLGGDEGHDAVLLSGDLRILVKVVNGNTRLVILGKRGHFCFVECRGMFESPFYAVV